MADIAIETLALLEWRLERVEFYLRGDAAPSEDAPAEGDGVNETISARLKNIEERFVRICSDFPSASELVKLHNRFSQASTLASADDGDDSGLAEFDKLQVVLSSASSIAQTASQLGSLQEHPLPDARALVSLAALRARVARARQIQEEQLIEIEILRTRSAKILARWYEQSLLGGDEQWAEWETRTAKMEQAILRAERAREREANEI